MRFFYIKRTGRAKHGEVPYAVCAYCMEKLFQNMYLETRLRQQLYLTLAKQIIDNLFKIILLIMMTQSNTNKCFIILKPRTDFIQKIGSSGMRQDSSVQNIRRVSYDHQTIRKQHVRTERQLKPVLQQLNYQYVTIVVLRLKNSAQMCGD